MTYYQLETILRENNYNGLRRQKLQSLSGIKTVAILIDTAPVFLDEKKKKLQDLLAGMPVKIEKFPNQAHIELKITK